MKETTDGGRHPASCSRRMFLGSVGGACLGLTLARNAGAEEPGTQPPEARFYEKLEGDDVRCLLCPWSCVVGPGERGRCRVRENRSGRYYSLVYGRPCARNNDPIEKKPLFHVYPGSRAYSIATVGCNLECRFCQNWDISQASPEDVPAPYRSPAQIAAEAGQTGARTIAYTYSEPTVFAEYMIDCAKAARKRGIGNVCISSGFIAAEPLKEIASLMTAIKIDLKAFTPAFYENTCSARLEPVLSALKQIVSRGTWLEVVVLVIPTLNDSSREISEMSRWIVRELGPNVPIHFTRYHPAYKIRGIPPTPPATLETARKTAMGEGCRFVYAGNMPGMPGEKTGCPECGRVLIDRYGFRVTENRIRDGKCPDCGSVIPGVWS
jgi:pyruvate formate lyase activating enzyme